MRYPKIYPQKSGLEKFLWPDLDSFFGSEKMARGNGVRSIFHFLPFQSVIPKTQPERFGMADNCQSCQGIRKLMYRLPFVWIIVIFLAWSGIAFSVEKAKMKEFWQRLGYAEFSEEQSSLAQEADALLRSVEGTKALAIWEELGKELPDNLAVNWRMIC